MVNPITETLFTQLTSGQWAQFFTVLFNQYFPFGSFFWLAGFIIMFLAHLKTKNLAFGILLGSAFFIIMPETGLITNIYSVTMMRWFGVAAGLIAGFYLYRSLRG